MSWGLVLVFPALVSLAEAKPVSAQSIVAAEIGGTVTNATGGFVREAAVTLVAIQSRIARATETSIDGLFDFDFVRAGSYDIRVESLGFRPVLVTGLQVGSGQRVQISVELTPQTPPVTQVDTVRWGSADLPSSGAVVARRLRGSELRALPDLRRDLSQLVALSSIADAGLGIEGLTGAEAVVFAEGEAFRPAAHPHQRMRTLAGLPFPRLGLASGSVGQGMEDIEWAGAPGGVIVLESRGAEGDASGGGFGMWSSDALLSSDLVTDPASSTSIWGGAELSFALIPDTALLAISFEGMRLQSPLIPSARDSLVASVLGEDAPLAEQPGLTETFVAAGTARADWALAGGGHITTRLGFASFRRESDRLGTPTLGLGREGPVEGTDGSVAAIVWSPLTENVLLEVRGGVGFSSRDYEAVDPSLPGAWVIGSGAFVGTDPAFAGKFSRTDVGLGPTLHYRSGPNRAKVGLRFEVTSYDDEYVEDSRGAFVFGDDGGLLGGEGAFYRALGSVPATTYSIPRVSGFGQYRWAVMPGMDLTTGIRFEQESLPRDEVRLAGDWLAFSGLRNDEFEDKLTKLDARLHLRWDLMNNGRSWLIGGIALQNGQLDPGVISEVLTLDGAVRAQRGLGEVGAWPTPPDSASAPVFGKRLALFGPDLKSPQTTRGVVSFSTGLGGGLTLSLTGSFRRTEFLLRRADLNRTDLPVGSDQNGRALYGPLQIVDGVLGADPELNRRFPDFESVWAHNADGWSEYRGVTVAMESDFGEGGSLSAHYTFSETTDNRVGLLSGRAAAQLSPGLDIENWDEGISDLDIPQRAAVAAVLPFSFGSIAGVYKYRSGYPFTPMVAAGLDANGDGSVFNDVAFIPTSGLPTGGAAFDCLAAFQGAFPDRNECRGESVHTLDLRLTIGLGTLGGSNAQLVIDAMNVMDAETGIPNPALLSITPGGSVGTDSGGNAQVPYRVNSAFGAVIPGTNPGRWLRVGLRLGGGP